MKRKSAQPWKSRKS